MKKTLYTYIILGRRLLEKFTKQRSSKTENIQNKNFKTTNVRKST